MHPLSVIASMEIATTLAARLVILHSLRLMVAAIDLW
jgi:hypothetical protein